VVTPLPFIEDQHLVGDHAFEGTKTIQTRIVGTDITGTGACS
jgi:hypothetical protein